MSEKRKLTERQLEAKRYLEEDVIPLLDGMFERSNPLAYQVYGGSACRQYALFGSALLTELLPEYDWQVWEGHFSDRFNNEPVEYEHAWIYARNKTATGQLLVDLSRNYHERLFIEVNQNKYPKTHPTYEHMRLLRKKRAPVQEYWQDREFYTSLTADELLARIKNDTPFEQVLEKIKMR